MSMEGIFGKPQERKSARAARKPAFPDGRMTQRALKERTAGFESGKDGDPLKRATGSYRSL
jgi:hypothetical protein